MTPVPLGRVFVKVVCTGGWYVDPESGERVARHERAVLGQYPVWVERDEDGEEVPGTEYFSSAPAANLNPRYVFKCRECGRHVQGNTLYADQGGMWNRIIRHWLDTDPERRVLIVDISDPVYPW